MQRFFDVLFSGSALLILSPLLLVVAVVLRFTGEGEVFYVQQRVGKGGRMFGLLKFATMLKDSPNIGTGTVTVKDDPRVLPVGRVLRKTKINELPQLINVLKGDMSLIGPRPQTRRCFDAFPRDQQAAIIKVRPGLSGIGSIVFSHEEDLLLGNEDSLKFYDDVIAPYKGALEQWYVQNQGVAVYLTLIVLTIWVLLTGRTALIYNVFPSLPKPPEDLQFNPFRPATGK